VVAASEDMPPYIFSVAGISAADMPPAYAIFGRRPLPAFSEMFQYYPCLPVVITFPTFVLFWK
jgi:hypothetical protein